MKHFGKLAVLGAVLAASTSFAFADTVTVTGEFWNAGASNINPCNPITQNCTGTQGNIPSSLPSIGSATTTFTITNTNAANLFDFFLPGSSNDFNLSSFLNFGTDTVTLGTPVAGLSNIDNGLFEFVGTTTVTTGEVLSLTHDDGADLFLNGIEVISAGGPTSSEVSTYTVPVGGAYSFEVLYAEVNGAPAVLDASLGTLEAPPATPEPSSLMLLGTGLLGAAGMFYRRRQTV